MHRVVKNLLVSLTLLFSTSICAIAATYYISPTGNNSSDGSTSTPWLTLAYAFTQMSGGDTLIVKDGTYTGTANMVTQSQHPPYGTAEAYTQVIAEHTGQAIFDGEYTRGMFSVQFNTGYTDVYWRFEGLFWQNCTQGVGMYRSRYFKFIRCGNKDESEGNSVSFGGGNCEYGLFEECYAYGSGRYKYNFGNSTACIVRSSIARSDRVTCVDPLGSFTFYGGYNCEAQNCISIDNDQDHMYRWGATPPYTGELMGSFGNPTSGASTVLSKSRFVNCIALNSHLGGGTNSANYDTVFDNCSFWDIQSQNTSNSVFWCREDTTTIKNCLIGKVTNYAGGGITFYYITSGTFVNNIVYGFERNPALNMGNGDHDYNALFANADNYQNTVQSANEIINNSPIWSVSNSSGALKYITRTEPGNSLEGLGQGGSNIGPDIQYLVGAKETLWGEEGYNTVTSTPMWPFPNESLIKDKMKEYYVSNTTGTVTGYRGFCSTTTKQLDGVHDVTLTSYIWEYLGNPMPAEYNEDTHATYYVRKDGSDVSGIGSSTAPWATLNKAFTTMQAGDTLIVGTGTYTGTSNCISGTNYPPLGTSTSTWTTIRAEVRGGVIIDGESTRYPLTYSASGSPVYWVFDGIEFINSSGYCTYLDNTSYVKFLNCGSKDASNGNVAQNCVTNGGGYVLYEDCYAYGNARQTYLVYKSSHVILRRCVSRLDSMNDTNPIQVNAFYDSTYCEAQNCIVLDSDQDQYYTGETDLAGAFVTPSTNGLAEEGIGHNFYGCISLNNNIGGFAFSGQSATAQTKQPSLINSVFWDINAYGNNLFQPQCSTGTIKNNTFGRSNTTQRIFAGNTNTLNTVIQNNLIFNNYTSGDESTGWLFYYCNTSSHNVIYENTYASGYFNTVSTYNVTNLDPLYRSTNTAGGLKYLPRIESGSNISGIGEGGSDIGANIIYGYGVSGTLWGEDGYNVLTSTKLWPFPNEGLIQEKMRAYDVTNATAGYRGFCSTTSLAVDQSSMTLTKYIWEYLGNQIPLEIYGSSGTPTPVIVDTFTISGVVTTVEALPIANVQMTLSIGMSSVTYTNESGYYQFLISTDVLSYIVTPTLEGYTFNPTQFNFPGVSGDVSVPTFFGTPPTPVDVSRRMLFKGVKLKGVKIGYFPLILETYYLLYGGDNLTHEGDILIQKEDQP